MNDQLPNFTTLKVDDVKKDVNSFDVQDHLDGIRESNILKEYEEVLNDPAGRAELSIDELTLVFGVYKLALLLERVENEWEPRSNA